MNDGRAQLVTMEAWCLSDEDEEARNARERIPRRSRAFRVQTLYDMRMFEVVR